MPIHHHHNRVARLFAVLAVLCLLAAPAFSQTALEIQWDPEFSAHSTDNYMDDILIDGDVIYAGGAFQFAGGEPVNYVAKWDGETWMAIATGVGTAQMGLVHTIAKRGDVIYVGGMFDQVGIWPAPNIAQWDPQRNQWRDVGRGTDRAVRMIDIDDRGMVYAVGEFTASEGGDLPSQAIAMWDPDRQEWSDVGGSVNERGARMRSVVCVGNDVYVGGFFRNIGGVTANHFAKFDGERWHGFAGGFDHLVTDIAVADDGTIYAGGAFNEAGGRTARGIAMWKGGQWRPLGHGLSGGPSTLNVRAILIDGDDVYVGGSFTHADGKPVNHIARWDGSEWHEVGGGTDGSVKVIKRWGDDYLVGGNFTTAGGYDSPHFARFTCPSKAPEETPSDPATFRMEQNYPNPFNPRTTIEFSLESRQVVSLRIYNLAGQLVRTLIPPTEVGEGTHFEDWSGEDDGGRTVASGMYVYRLEAEGQSVSKKMILLK